MLRHFKARTTATEWRPLMLAVLRHLAGWGKPLVCIGFGAAAESILREAGLDEERRGPSPRVILRPHPAETDRVFALENPFTFCNRLLEAVHGVPIDW